MAKRKWILIFALCISVILAACMNEHVTYEAKACDIEEEGFERNSQRIVVLGDELVIFASYNNPDTKRKTSIDKLLETEDAVSGEYYKKRYEM